MVVICVPSFFPVTVAPLRASCQQTCMVYAIAVCTVKTPDDGQRNCPKHVDFYCKNKFEELVHLVGLIIRISHDARSPERQIRNQHSHLYSLNPHWSVSV